MRIERDDKAGLLYIELREGRVNRTEQMANGAFLDLDAEGGVIGVEFLSTEAFEAFVKDRDLPTSILDWLRDEVGPCQMVGPQ